MISDLLTTLESGARKNKYRVIVPTLSGIDEDVNTLCHTTSLPGRNLTPTEVIVKGRKAQLRGETSYDGTWEMTIYNTENMEIRNFFIKWMQEIHDTGMDRGIILGDLSLNGTSLNSTISTGASIIDGVSSIIANPFGSSSYPSYQRDISIEQLNSDGNETYKVILKGAFPTAVGAVDLDDATGEVSTTSITFTYTDIEIGGAGGGSNILSTIAGAAVSKLL